MPVKWMHAKVNHHCLILLKHHLSERVHSCGGICNPIFWGSDRSIGRTLGGARRLVGRWGFNPVQVVSLAYLLEYIQYIPQPISCPHWTPCMAKPPQSGLVAAGRPPAGLPLLILSILLTPKEKVRPLCPCRLQFFLLSFSSVQI